MYSMFALYSDKKHHRVFQFDRAEKKVLGIAVGRTTVCFGLHCVNFYCCAWIECASDAHEFRFLQQNRLNSLISLVFLVCQACFLPSVKNPLISDMPRKTCYRTRQGNYLQRYSMLGCRQQYTDSKETNQMCTLYSGTLILLLLMSVSFTF